MSDEDSGNNQIEQDVEKEMAALVKVDHPSLANVRPRPVGISAPAEQGGINHLAMNCIIPGLGSLVRGNKGTGAAQLGLAVTGLFMILTGHFALGLLAGLSGYLWSVVSGFGFLGKSKSAW